jgi:hypothetical protein
VPYRLLIRIQAAVRIQAWYRGSSHRNKLIGVLMGKVNWSQVRVDNSKYREYCVVMRAVTTIQ